MLDEQTRHMLAHSISDELLYQRLGRTVKLSCLHAPLDPVQRYDVTFGNCHHLTLAYIDFLINEQDSQLSASYRHQTLVIRPL